METLILYDDLYIHDIFKGGLLAMLQDFMWTTFEKTGNIDAYLYCKEIEKNATREQEYEEIQRITY